MSDDRDPSCWARAGTHRPVSLLAVQNDATPRSKGPASSVGGSARVAEVVLDRVGKVYPDGTRAVRDLNLDVDDKEFLVLVGPSGCGKTTALRMVAGLEDISEGEVRIGDRVVNRVPARDRDVAMVFQSYAL